MEKERRSAVTAERLLREAPSTDSAGAARRTVCDLSVSIPQSLRFESWVYACARTVLANRDASDLTAVPRSHTSESFAFSEKR